MSEKLNKGQLFAVALIVAGILEGAAGNLLIHRDTVICGAITGFLGAVLLWISSE